MLDSLFVSLRVCVFFVFLVGCWPVIIIIITVIILRPQAHITVQSYYHCIHPAATGQSLHAQLAIMRMMLIVVIITIVRSHLGSSVRVGCEGRLLPNEVRGFTNRDVDCNMVSRVLFRGHLIPYFAEDWEGQ